MANKKLETVASGLRLRSRRLTMVEERPRPKPVKKNLAFCKYAEYAGSYE
jgi:hypothetical protein